MKILHLDIETAPNLAHVWKLWKTDVALNQLIAPGYILCWAAKWDGKPDVYFASLHAHGQQGMLTGIHALLSEADAIVTYNGTAFDVPTLNAEFAQLGFAPPAPYQHIDLYLAVKKRFRFPSLKLEYVAKALGVGAKVKHEGHGLWVKCMAGDLAAWQRMERYNKRDVLLQERVYRRLLPWIPNHPNRALYVTTANGEPCCPHCGSKRLKSNGFRVTQVQVYRRYYCLKCRAWSRGNEPKRAPVLRRVA